MKTYLSLFVCFLLIGCVKIPTQPLPPLTTTIFPSTIAKHPSPPPALTSLESASDWGREYSIGKAFANEGDLYRALTSFHRARLLIGEHARKPQLLHAIVLCYCLGKKYQEAVDIWEQERHSLHFNDPLLSEDCIQMLFEAYCRIGREFEAIQLLQDIPNNKPLQQSLTLFKTLSCNEELPFIAAPEIARTVGKKEHQDAENIVIWYKLQKRNPSTASLLNGLLPGLGYCYVRQYQTGLTSFAMNALFITATTQLYTSKQHAAALLAGGFELGWYLGGITGAHLAAQFHNQRLRELVGKPYLKRYKLFPLQTVHYSW